MTKKQKEEKVKEFSKNKPTSNSKRSLDRKDYNPTIEMEDDSDRSIERQSERPVLERFPHQERTIEVIDDHRPAASQPHNQEPSLTDIFKQIIKGGGDIFKPQEKPKVIQKAVIKALQEKKPVKLQVEDKNYSQKSSTRSKSRGQQMDDHTNKTRHILKKFTIKDMVIAKTILDTPYIDK